MEPMEVAEVAPSSSTSKTTSTTVKDSAIDVTIDDQSTGSNVSSQKPQKSVSFEDNESYIENNGEYNETSRAVHQKRKQMKQHQKEQPKESKKSSEAEGSDGIITYLRRQHLKHQQQVVADEGPSVESLEIGSKKDRRHRSGMKSSGLFGPEGRCFFQICSVNI